MTLAPARAAPRRSLRRAHAERGVTLIEISIALAIVGLVVFVALPSIEAFAGVKAREEAGRISGAIRYMYGTSVLSGKVCRMVFDMDARQYWAECTEGRFTLDREKERSRGGQRIDEKDSPSRGFGSKEAEEMRAQIEKKAEFSDFSTEDVTKRTLPNGATLSVWVAHQREKYTQGRAYLYFFPQGHTEKAQVVVSNEHGTVYTVVTSPLNGRVKVVGEELPVPKD